MEIRARRRPDGEEEPGPVAPPGHMGRREGSTLDRAGDQFLGVRLGTTDEGLELGQ